jgi:hypothetical protein
MKQSGSTPTLGVAMTMMQSRAYEEEREEKYDFELPAQLDDDEDFEPTIVRGRE